MTYPTSHSIIDQAVPILSCLSRISLYSCFIMISLYSWIIIITIRDYIAMNVKQERCNELVEEY